MSRRAAKADKPNLKRPKAMIRPKAMVRPKAKLWSKAMIRPKAKLWPKAMIRPRAMVRLKAKLWPKAKLMPKAITCHFHAAPTSMLDGCKQHSREGPPQWRRAERQGPQGCGQGGWECCLPGKTIGGGGESQGAEE
jgi:hypothetical protein